MQGDRIWEQQEEIWLATKKSQNELASCEHHLFIPLSKYAISSIFQALDDSY